MAVQRGLEWKEGEYLTLLSLSYWVDEKKQGKTTFPLVSQIYVLTGHMEASEATESTQTVHRLHFIAQLWSANQRRFQALMGGTRSSFFNFNIPGGSVNQSGAVYEAVFMWEWECIVFSVSARESTTPNIQETLPLDFASLQHWLSSFIISGHLLNLLNNGRSS